MTFWFWHGKQWKAAHPWDRPEHDAFKVGHQRAGGAHLRIPVIVITQSAPS
jgi:hypothetical protein